MENNTWLIALAVIAVVAIVAVFGMVSMTGYAVKNNNQVICITQAVEYHKLHITECNDVAVEDRLACIDKANTAFHLELNACGLGNSGGSGNCKQITDCNTCQATEGCCWDGSSCFAPDYGTLCMITDCRMDQIEVLR